MSSFDFDDEERLILLVCDIGTGRRKEAFGLRIKLVGSLLTFMSNPLQKQIEPHLYRIAEYYEDDSDEGYESALKEAEESLSATLLNLFFDLAISHLFYL